MRSVRHLRAPRSRQPDLSRALRASAPRPGERGHRRIGRRATCGSPSRWAMSRTHSPRRRSRSCRARSPSATSATPPPATATIDNAQPILIECAHGQIAIGHNGNLVNASELKDELGRRGSIFQTSTDTEVILHLYARSRRRRPTTRSSKRFPTCRVRFRSC